MKPGSKLFWIFCLLCLNAVSQWTWENPLPTGVNYRGCYFTDELHGWIVGDGGCIIRTGDGGINWEVMESGIESDLYSVYFVDNYYGWAAGVNSTIIKTRDGGKNWEVQKDNPYGIYISSIYFSDTLTGWTDGQGSGELYHTADGGENWNTIVIPGAKPITEIFFSDPFLGWAGTTDTVIFSTNDGGNTWTGHSTPARQDEIFFLNSDTGWFATMGDIYRTNDGANSWIPQSNPFYYKNIFELKFLDRNHGWGVGDGCIIHTSDGGNTWQVQPYDYNLNAVFMTDTLNGWAAGGWYGDLLQTNDGGHSWIQRRQGFTGYVLQVSISDGDYGIAVPFGGSEGFILETYNGGENWQERHITDEDINFQDVFQLDSRTAWICGYDGNIYHTGNGGEEWIQQNGDHPELTLFGIQFLNLTDGFAIGMDTSYLSFMFLKTVDGGNSWSMASKDFNGIVTDMCFTDNDNGYVTAYNFELNQAFIFITRTGGQFWEELTLPLNNYDSPQSIQFLNDSAGFICTSHSILKSTSYGESWERKPLGQYNLQSSYFLDSQNGWAVGNNAQQGIIIRTADGGQNWERIPVETDNYFYDVFFRDDNNGWVSGWGGTILKWGNGVPVIVEEPSVNDNELRCTVSPNPCDKFTSLGFELKFGDIGSLSLYTVDGKMILCPLKINYQKGNHKIPIDVQSMESGLYLYKLTIGEKTVSGKIIVLH